MSNVPKITEQRFTAIPIAWIFVLGAIKDGVVPAKAIRAYLESRGVYQSSPSFYLMLMRMEEKSLIKGQSRTRVVGNQPITEKWFEVLPRGSEEYSRVAQAMKSEFSDMTWSQPSRSVAAASTGAHRRQRD
jgi:hypothetical protein